MEPTPDDRGPPKEPRSEVRRSIAPQVMSFYPRFDDGFSRQMHLCARQEWISETSFRKYLQNVDIWLERLSFTS